MSRCLILALMVQGLCAPCLAELITQWNFNGSTTAFPGYGSAVLIGDTTAAFSSGSTNDPVGSGNQAWNLSHFPAQGGSNKLAGAEFHVTTEGYCNIQIRWDHRVSSTASRYCRLQFSPDGITFYDFPQAIVANEVSMSTTYFETKNVDLSGFTYMENNQNFTFRIVSEFESSALGYGQDAYVTTYGTNSYRTTGTVRLDMLTVSGDRIPDVNTPPQISSFTNRIVRLGQTVGPIPFTISDAEDSPENLHAVAWSSNQVVLPDANLRLTGQGAQRSLTVLSTKNSGESLVSVAVIDTQARSNSSSFLIMVLPSNLPPSISQVPPTNTLAGTSVGPISFLVGDSESSAQLLEVTATSRAPLIIPNDGTHLLLDGCGSNRTITLTPLPTTWGIAPIDLSVSDGQCSATCSFSVLVTPSWEIVFFDPFNYPDGSVVTNSGFLWDNRSGTYGECQVSGGQLRLSYTQTEDVVTRLAGAPFARSNATVLYASFMLRLLGVPKSTPDYFAHFMGGSALRARLFAKASESLSDGYHLLISNGSTTNAEHAATLLTNNQYKVVIRYDVDRASSKLWVNPRNEADPGAAAMDVQAPVSITSFGFRQSSGLGTSAMVDDLKVGLSFASVTRELPPVGTSLTATHEANRIVLRWLDPSYVLESSGLAVGPFTNVPNATNPFTNTLTGKQRFYRLRRSL